MPLVVAFLGGLAGSLHCVGMCGGFPIALARSGSPRPWLRQFLYNAGRLNTLVFIGALSGGLGAAVVAAGPVQWIERILAIVAGSLMILIGLEGLGLLGRVSARFAALVQATVGRWLAGVVSSPSPAAPLALGVVNAFLPCHLIYAFAASAAATASVGRGMLVMLAFGLGTCPAMLTLGLSRRLAAPGVRARLSFVAGALVVVFGAITLARGVVGPDLHPHAGHAPATRAPAAGPSAARPEAGLAGHAH
jgi:sulfite exporter TauE/SafE